MNYFIIKCRHFYAPQICKFEFVTNAEYEYAHEGLIILHGLQHGLCILEHNESQRPEYKLANFKDRERFRSAFNGEWSSFECDWSTCINPQLPNPEEIARVYNVYICRVFEEIKCISEYGLGE